MDAAKIGELKLLVEQCKSNPSILHNPSLSFFKSYLESLGARIPPASAPKPDKDGEDISHSKGQFDTKNSNYSVDNKLDEDIVESDVELDNADVVEPDNDPPQKMGDPSIEITEESQDAAQISKSNAMDAICEGKFNKAVDFLTEAIMLNPTSAILYATRASVFIKLKKPNAAICDADAALKINPDSAKGYKMRGMARAMLGLWEAAASDLHVASNIDYDEEIGEVLKKVEPNAHKIEEHRRKYERLRKEREQTKIELERQRRRAAQEQEDASALKDGKTFGSISNLFFDRCLSCENVIHLSS
ncbi:unnamed protein product [Ilex paraguariensis]|uniref:Hsp70-interacting protein N-terminal domain-containing protein n=1 Tax=Ilex paraguariensis TaxID=185542 RepID=A0ABC8TBF2_9AQUA